MANQTRQKFCRLSSEPSTVINLCSITRFAICMRPVTDMLSGSLQSEHLDCARYFYRSFEIPVFRNKNTMNHLRTLHSPRMCLLATPTRGESPEVGGGMDALMLQPRLLTCCLQAKNVQFWLSSLIISSNPDVPNRPKNLTEKLMHFSTKTWILASTAVTLSRSIHILQQLGRCKKTVVFWPQPIFGPFHSLRAFKGGKLAKTVEILKRVLKCAIVAARPLFVPWYNWNSVANKCLIYYIYLSSSIPQRNAPNLGDLSLSFSWKLVPSNSKCPSVNTPTFNRHRSSI